MLYLKDGDRFLMASKKRPNNKTSNYLISMGKKTHASVDANASTIVTACGDKATYSRGVVYRVSFFSSLVSSFTAPLLPPLSTGEGDLSRDGANYLGKLRSNFVGTEFQVTIIPFPIFLRDILSQCPYCSFD
jgi:hypothetical protein